MSQPIPSFWDSPYFVPEPDNWHLTEDAPPELKKEFEEYMKGENVDSAINRWAIPRPEQINKK